MHTCGTLVLVRLGEMIRVHTETMIPNGRPDEITIEPKQIRKRSVQIFLTTLAIVVVTRRERSEPSCECNRDFATVTRSWVGSGRCQ
jgi:hypothetical protein